MIVEATGKVMQVLSKIEGVSAKTGKAWEKYTYLIEQSGMRPTSLVVSVFNYGEHVGELLNMGDTVRMSLRIEAHYDLHERKHAFLMAKERLESQGYDPVNPFDNGVPDNAHWREHMRADIAMLLKCDAIFMLPGWELSKGCKLELDVASSCGIAVIIEPVQPCDYDVKKSGAETCVLP